MPRRTAHTEWVDRQCYEMRQLNQSWAYIAQQLNLSGESVARTAANRHRERLGIVTEINTRRSAAGRLAAERRHGRATTPIAPEGRANLVQNIVLPIGQRTFGAEIEFTGKYKHQAARDIAEVLNANGVTVAEYMGAPHIHSMPYHGDRCEVCGVTVTDKYRHWRVERDGSVTQHRRHGEFGGEVVSPILTTADFNQLGLVLKALRAESNHPETGKGKVSASCGLHIHVGVSDLTPDQRANVVKQWYGFADVVHTFVAQNRVGGTYSRSMSSQELSRVVNLLQNGTRDRYAFERVTEKYRSLNVLPFPKIGTFEFRLHQGTLNFNKVRNWVTLLLAFVQAFATDEMAPTSDTSMATASRTAINTVSLLDLLISKTDATNKLSKFYLKRQRQFTPSVANLTNEIITSGGVIPVARLANISDNERSEF